MRKAMGIFWPALLGGAIVGVMAQQPGVQVAAYAIVAAAVVTALSFIVEIDVDRQRRFEDVDALARHDRTADRRGS